MAELLFGVAPPGTEDLLRFAITVRGQRPIYLLIGAVLLSAIGASGVVLSLVDGFQFAYRVRNRRSFWRHRGIAMLLVFVLAMPALCAAALVLYFQSALIYIPSVVAVGLSIFLLYRFGPDLPSDLRRAPIWPGAVVATAIWMISTVIFVWYLRNLANYNVVYGSIGAVVALLVWLYILAASALIGCEYNAERMREDIRPA
jgi:membrane protein